MGRMVRASLHISSIPKAILVKKNDDVPCYKKKKKERKKEEKLKKYDKKIEKKES
jgi:hypothetical protein